jgi:broad specificity phosphatase PhoE
MARYIYFITHPNVVISAEVPVTQWPLSELGRTRMHKILDHPWVSEVTAIYSSAEQKAIDGAAILGDHLSLPVGQVHALGENDRTSTGFLAPAEFEQVADEFFARPGQSVRGWERAVDAQARILAAVREIVATDTTAGSIAIVSHGAVGALLYCAIAGKSISRKFDQPGNGGGNFFRCSLAPLVTDHDWRPIDRIDPSQMPSTGGIEPPVNPPS